MTASVRFLGTFLLGLTLLGSGCAASAGPAKEPEPTHAPPPPESDEVPIEEEAPEVARCHTETQQCDLTEPLPPGAGCFCTGTDGAKDAGTAGG